MKSVEDLSRGELEDLVEEIREILYLTTVYTEQGSPWKNVWNPDKEWNSETLECINNALGEYGLIPAREEEKIDDDFLYYAGDKDGEI